MARYDDVADKLEELEESLDHVSKIIERIEKKLDALKLKGTTVV